MRIIELEEAREIAKSSEATHVRFTYANHSYHEYPIEKLGEAIESHKWSRLGLHYGVKLNDECEIKNEGMAWAAFAKRKETHQTVQDFSAELAATEIPLRRLQSASDIANGFVFLTSKEASEITGAVLNIGGGVVMD